MLYYLSHREIEAALSRIVTYHGTNASNLPEILRNGIEARSPQGRFDKGVYLTMDLETAARYAVEGSGGTREEQPCILEIAISRANRIKKLYRDPLDRQEDHSAYEDNDNYDSDIEELEADLQEVTGLSSYELNKALGIDFENFGDPTKLRGINLYKLLLNYARRKNIDINEFKKKMFQVIPQGNNYGKWDVAEDGTITINEAVYENMLQKIYPKNLPSKTVQAVWLTNIPDNVPGDRKTIKSKLLPQETKDINDKILRIAREVYGNMSQDDMNYLVEKIEDMEAVTAEYRDDFPALKQAVIDNDVEKFRGIIEEWQQDVYDKGDEPRYGASTTFVRLSPQDALKYVSIKQTASIRLSERDKVPQTETPEFKSWFGDSQVVDSQGKPLMVHHQTNAQFDTFDRDKSADGLLWFTANEDHIKSHETGAAGNKYTMNVYLFAQKLAGWDEYDKYVIDQLIQMGYDGIKLDDNYVVFESDQIRRIL